MIASKGRNVFLTGFFVLVILLLPGHAGAVPSCSPTESDIEGPYYLPGSPLRTDLVSDGEQGFPLVMRGTVYQSDCTTPISRARIEVWQTDAQGRYYGRDDNYRLRGQMRSDEEGRFEFSTIKPGRYRLMRGYRPAHIHIRVFHPDYEVLITQLYFKDDPYLWPNDACGSACKSGDPLRIIELKKAGEKDSERLEGVFTVVLSPLKKR